jgi:hypothetical protein
MLAFSTGRGARGFMIKRSIPFLIFLIVAAAFFYYYWSGGLIANSPTDMLATAKSFLEDVGAGRIDNAYGRTSASFRMQHSPEQFRSLLDKYPVLKTSTTRNMNGYEVVPTWTRGTAEYNATLLQAKESLPVRLRLVTEEAVWKVDELAVGAK